MALQSIALILLQKMKIVHFKDPYIWYFQSQNITQSGKADSTIVNTSRQIFQNKKRLNNSVMLASGWYIVIKTRYSHLGILVHGYIKSVK